MHYIVTAHFKSETAAEFHRKLTDGTIASQKPDGKEIVDSMHRAKLGEESLVRWSEACYCPTPLEHERATVYDHFFDGIETEEVNGHMDLEGDEFMGHLARLVE
jgi:hypothetical protein